MANSRVLYVRTNLYPSLRHLSTEDRLIALLVSYHTV